MNILVKDHYCGEALARLNEIEDIRLTHSTDLQLSDTELEETEILLIRSGTKLPQEVLAKTERLRFIVTATSGFDHIDLVYCEHARIKVAHTPDANRDGVAELTMMLMLNSIRHSRESSQSIEANSWRSVVPRGHTLAGKRLGIVGLGRVGSRVAELARGFKMNVAAFDPYQDDEQFARYGVDRMDYTELLAHSHIVTYHVPLTNETRHMVNHETLSFVSEDAIIINTCRGEVVDERELYRALKEHEIAAAGLDVFEEEPLPEASPLRHLPNVTMTPHVGAYTYESVSTASHLAVQDVFLFLENKAIPSLLV
ncbi:MAG: phosphoglycerate dehydrogenase [Candidatus Latescibacteria bacterium]|nr:phosphoglycerate dehydrogenase [Candidatus Latescibacterota bacterium]